MKYRKFILGIASFTVIYTVLEVFSRMTLVFFGHSFFSPERFIIDNYYKELKTPLETEISANDGYTDILILGGSAISSLWSRMDVRLDSLLSRKDVRVFNVAESGHSSLDNAIKYDMLKDKKFDLVIYYEGINENRENNTLRELFREDYSDREWYYQIGLLRKHSELKYTAVPYLLHRAVSAIIMKVTNKPILENDGFRKEYKTYGNDIKTAVPYKKNIEAIIALANQKQEKLLLMAYVSFFPEVSFSGGTSDAQYFAKNCARGTLVTVWGEPANTKKGIGVHNEILTQLAARYRTYYLDVRDVIPQKTEYFCDICHFSEEGCRLFAKTLAEYITTNHILDKRTIN